MTIEEQLQRLTGIVESLASSVVAHDDLIEAHDNQIEGLIRIAAAQSSQIAAMSHDMDKLKELVAATERQWQAYLTTLPRQ